MIKCTDARDITRPTVNLIIIMLALAGGVVGGGTTAILFNTPETPASVATTFGNYKVVKISEILNNN
ncbi:tripartite tricarboxylate transporter permease [Sporosarcina globispora]|uniref:tripartite tricarboxylate transporter permease n=1 Tax=Sporosarcina globispora TaxID=1459 RepID=UPI003BF47543